MDLLLRGGWVVDGTARARFRADIGVAAGRITVVGESAGVSADRVLDVTDCTVAPGFIDVHGHSDIAVLSAPAVPSKIQQGVTTEVMGNCGLSVCPIALDVDVAAMRALMAIVDVDSGVGWDWRSAQEYLDRVDQARPAMNVAILAGHLPVRASCVGYADRPATHAELGRMQRMADQALRDGAIGVSTGLMYAPNAYADLDELVALGEVVADHGAIFAMHLRDYAERLTESVREGIEVARRTGCRVHLSHLSVVGRRNWGAVTPVLQRVERARCEGLDVALDTHTYLAGSTNLTQLLPQWALADGSAQLLARLGDPATRQRIARDLDAERRLGWDEVLVVGLGEVDRSELIGRSVADLARDQGVPPAEMLLRVAETSDGSATILAFGRSADDLRAVLRHPLTMIGSDGLGLDCNGRSGRGRPHPRSYGCYPRLFGRYVREERVLSLEQAVHKCTLQGARRFGIPERGCVAPGWIADLVVFDADRIEDRTTFADPQQFPVGIRAVLVSGEPAVLDGAPTGARRGAALRRAELERDVGVAVHGTSG